jgi:hypothetical protein
MIVRESAVHFSKWPTLCEGGVPLGNMPSEETRNVLPLLMYRVRPCCHGITACTSGVTTEVINGYIKNCFPSKDLSYQCWPVPRF